MKRCPNCGLKYADDTQQFCLTDGTQLIVLSAAETQADEPATYISGSANTATKSAASRSFLNETPEFAGMQRESAELPQSQTEASIESQNASAEFSTKFLAYAPIIIALSQNYWQWLYMNEYDSFTFPAFLLKITFWMWVFLLFGGAALCVRAIQKSQNVPLAIVGLVILAINFLLCLVPRR